jgi:hypothetical protein
MHNNVACNTSAMVWWALRRGTCNSRRCGGVIAVYVLSVMFEERAQPILTKLRPLLVRMEEVYARAPMARNCCEGLGATGRR